MSVLGGLGTSSGCNAFGGRFPAPPTSNQFLTPQTLALHPGLGLRVYSPP